MHEVSLARSLLRRVAAAAAAHEARAVRRVRVRVGALSGVDADLLATAFRHERLADPVCSAAELEVLAEAGIWRCPACGGSIDASGPLACGGCGVAAELAQGDALVLEGLDLEVANDV